MYTLDESEKGKEKRGRKGHLHKHAHRGNAKPFHGDKIGKRSVGQLISATIDGLLVSWTNEYAGPTVATDLPAHSPMIANSDGSGSHKTITASAISTPFIDKSKVLDTGSQHKSKTASKANSFSQGTWIRQAYYDAASGTAEGLVFLNHFGGMDGIPGTAAGGPASVQSSLTIETIR